VLRRPIEGDLGEVIQHALQVGVHRVHHTRPQGFVDNVLIMTYTECAEDEIGYRQSIRRVLITELDDFFYALDQRCISEDGSPAVDFLVQSAL
jgi:hypothetical protein